MITDGNITVSGIEKWVNSGLDVNGIPFINKLHEISWFQWEQITFDLITGVILVLIFMKILKNSVMGKQIDKKIDILIKDHRVDRYRNKKLFKELR